MRQMVEYIDRAQVIATLERYSTSRGSALGAHSGAIDCAQSKIENIPAADVAPVIHGHWIDCKDEYFDIKECSICSGKVEIAGTDEADEVSKNYCPYCGAKMDGGDENGDC